MGSFQSDASVASQNAMNQQAELVNSITLPQHRRSEHVGFGRAVVRVREEARQRSGLQEDRARRRRRLSRTRLAEEEAERISGSWSRKKSGGGAEEELDGA